MKRKPDDLMTQTQRPIKNKSIAREPLLSEREIRALSDLLDLATVLLTEDLSSEEAQKAAIDRIGHIIGADAWKVCLLSSTGELSDFMVSKGEAEGSDAQPLRLEMGELVRSAINEDRSLYSRDFDGRSIVCSPFRSDDQVAGGVLFFLEDGTGDKEASPRTLSAAANLIGAILESAGRFHWLHRRIADLELRQRQLINSRNTLRALFDNSPTAMYIIDRECNLLAINRQRATQVGKPPQALVNKRCYQALYSRREPCPACQVFNSLTTGSSTRRIDQRLSPNGELQEIEIRTFPIRDETGKPVEAFLFEEDITERIRLQTQLAQADKLAMTGQLAAGVAHEINNPLTVIMANAQLLQRRISPQEKELEEMVELIIQAGERATQSVRELLDFARRERFEAGEVDINASIRRVLGLVRYELSANSIELVFLPDETLPPVIASQEQLEGVWLNLLLNAIDAIHPGPGNIHISTRQSAGKVQVVFADNGHGIDAAQLPHIFEPFYSTKSPGRGTGLGLSICQQIIARHGGEIRVWSQPGVGTQFTITLP